MFLHLFEFGDKYRGNYDASVEVVIKELLCVGEGIHGWVVMGSHVAAQGHQQQNVPWVCTRCFFIKKTHSKTVLWKIVLELHILRWFSKKIVLESIKKNILKQFFIEPS